MGKIKKLNNEYGSLLNLQIEVNEELKVQVLEAKAETAEAKAETAIAKAALANSEAALANSEAETAIAKAALANSEAALIRAEVKIEEAEAKTKESDKRIARMKEIEKEIRKFRNKSHKECKNMRKLMQYYGFEKVSREGEYMDEKIAHIKTLQKIRELMGEYDYAAGISTSPPPKPADIDPKLIKFTKSKKDTRDFVSVSYSGSLFIESEAAI
jgi:multidrug efflux pump subunit AcrA (membrane-fusion protein)